MCGGGGRGMYSFGPGGYALVGLGVLTVPIWGPFALIAGIGYGGKKAVDSLSKNEKVLETIEKTNSYAKSMHDFLRPDALRVKIRELTAHLAWDPKNAVVLTKRGELYLLSGKMDDAEQDFLKALECTENVDPIAHFYLGVVHSAQGKHIEAVEDYSTALKNNDKRSVLSENAQKVGGWIDSFEDMRRSVKKKREGWTMGLTNALGMNDYFNIAPRMEHEEKTIDILDRVLNKTVTISEMYYNRALEYMYLYEYDNAVADFESVMEATDRDESQRENMPMYYFSYSNTLYYMGRLEESLLKIDTAIELALREYKEQFEWVVPTYFVQRACVYDRMYMHNEAYKDRQHAKELEPMINVAPFHIKLLDNDVVSNIMSFMDARTLLNTSQATRQLYALYKSIEVHLNPKAYGLPRALIQVLKSEGLVLGEKLYSRKSFSYDRRDNIIDFIKNKGPTLTMATVDLGKQDLVVAGYTSKSAVKDGEHISDDRMWLWQSHFSEHLYRISHSTGHEASFGLGAAIYVGCFHVDDFLSLTLFRNEAFEDWHSQKTLANASVAIYEVKPM